MHFEIPSALRGGLVLAMAAALAPAAIAQNISRSDGSTHAGVGNDLPVPPGTSAAGGAVTITQSATQNITPLNSVSCNSGGVHTDNSYFRVFDLASHGITSDFEITSVETGVEQSTPTGPSQPIEWKFYFLTDPAGSVTRANFTSIGTVPTTVPTLTAALHATAVTGVTAPAGSRLVVELFTPAGAAGPHSFFVGSNADGQTGPGYIEAAACGVTAPTNLASIGFPNMHWVLNVTGNVSSGPTVNTYPSTDTPIAVPDNNPTGITSTITIPPSANVVVDLDVDFNMTHSWIGDLTSSLTHGATAVTFLDRPGFTGTGFGCSGDNPNVVADDEGTDGALETSCVSAANPGYPVPDGHYTPNNPLSAFDGMDVEGTWTLNVNDQAGGDTGTLDAWALIITEDVGTAGPGAPVDSEIGLRVHPNPMVASGTVEVTVPVDQSVRVAVYDMLGREVMVLIDRTLAASQRAFMSVDAGRLTPGAYVIRAVGETFQTSQRVTITR
jgi:hypothetical protein